MKHLILAMAIIMIATSCNSSDHYEPQSSSADTCVVELGNGVYYWKTVFNLDNAESAFISQHNIRRMYIRMFDVVENITPTYINDRTIPNASLKVNYTNYELLHDSLGCQYIPVVYITLNALKAMKDHESALAENIVSRVENMCVYNGMQNVEELQLDCDWTTSTESSFFKLCNEIKTVIYEMKLPWALSSTIRLHQLSRKAPPVDKGVLMVYNTGNFNDVNTQNSILNINDVAPYIKNLSSYPLHLDVAYPNYSWQLLYHLKKFAGLMNGVDVNDTTQFKQINENSYIATREGAYNNRLIYPDDIIRVETSVPEEVFNVKTEIEKKLKGKPHFNIIYHLDSKNLSKYTANEIDSIYSTGSH
ncbi:MAG: hypothetical protein K2J74_00125 [Muribaculaceae bacterium]|nr:hypothetical protein [Muribaculaceae bacterium]